MPDHAPIQFRNQRYTERTGGAQCLDDEMFSVIADGQRVEGRDGDLGDGADVGVGFVADENLVIHQLLLAPCQDFLKFLFATYLLPGRRARRFEAIDRVTNVSSGHWASACA